MAAKFGTSDIDRQAAPKDREKLCFYCPASYPANYSSCPRCQLPLVLDTEAPGLAGVPASHRLGDENRGFVQVMQGFDFSRALIGLQVLAVARDESGQRRSDDDSTSPVAFAVLEGDSADLTRSFERSRAQDRPSCTRPTASSSRPTPTASSSVTRR